jgi:hypothetical protein
MQVSAQSEGGSCFHVGAVISVGADDTVELVRLECGDSRGETVAQSGPAMSPAAHPGLMVGLVNTRRENRDDRVPKQSADYRVARDQLLEKEIELRRPTTTTASSVLPTNQGTSTPTTTRRQVGPLQAIAVGPVQAIVSKGHPHRRSRRAAALLLRLGRAMSTLAGAAA